MLSSSVVSALRTVAVFGATGRVGQLVVQRLLSDGHAVQAVVRSSSKAAEVLGSAAELECRVLDLAEASDDEIRNACDGAESVIWCASGFTGDGKSVDVTGMAALPQAFMDEAGVKDAPPRVVMCSSAGVTRPAWKDEKKARLVGAADIPIIRLNPGGILDLKCEAEATLRNSGAPYCVVRPTGLKFDDTWPAARPILSQGDVAVGRTNPEDLADVLVRVLDEAAAEGKTFEMFTLAGYPAARSFTPALEMLHSDRAPPLDEAVVEATYSTLQQLLPGEEQDATKLEMGQTYEQVDSGDVAARERGAAPTAREEALSLGVAQGGGKRQALGNLFSKVFK